MVYDKTETAPQLAAALAWTNIRYELHGAWERDCWGNWHPPGSLAKATLAPVKNPPI